MLKPLRFWSCRLALTRALTIASVILSFVDVSSVRALNFQLRHIQTLDDGAKVDHTCFQYDESTEVLLDLPKDWSTSSTAICVTSSPPSRPNDQIQLEKSLLTPDTSFQEKGLETYRQRSLAMIPRGAQNIHVVGEQADPLPIFGWKDYEFTVDYDFYGQTFRRGTFFINIDSKLQLVMTTTSAPDTFAAMHTAAFRVLRSWCVAPKDAGNGLGDPASANK